MGRCPRRWNLMTLVIRPETHLRLGGIVAVSRAQAIQVERSQAILSATTVTSHRMIQVVLKKRSLRLLRWNSMPEQTIVMGECGYLYLDCAFFNGSLEFH
jgi:hypothetical protein